MQSRRLNSVIGKRRRPLNHPRHYLGRHGKHHLGLRLAQKLGKIDHLVGHAVDARQVLDARVALGHVEHAVSGADGRCRKVRHVLADARDGLARQRIAQLVDVVRAVDDLGATAAHEHVHQAFDAPELVHGLGRVGVAPGAQAKEHAALAQGADRRHGARGHRVLAREQRAVDIAEHGFDVAEGGVHGGLSGLCGGVGCIRERRTWYTKAQARPVKAKTTTKVPGPFVVEVTFAGQTITTFDVFRQNRGFYRML